MIGEADERSACGSGACVRCGLADECWFVIELLLSAAEAGIG